MAPVQELEKSDHPWIKAYFHGERGRHGCRRRTGRAVKETR